MSTSGLTNQYNPPTLDGLTIIEADELYVGGQEVDVGNLVPYTGATQTLDMGSQAIKTTYSPVVGPDVVNLTTLTNAIIFQDGANALTYLNKITTTAQTVAGQVTVNNTMKADYFFTDNSYNWGRTSASYNAWGIGRIAGTGGIIKDLQFKDDTASQTCLLLSSSGQTVYVGLTCDYGTASKVPIWDADKKLVSSGVDSIKITYLDNVSSDIQTQLNGKLDLSGSNANQNIILGSYKVQSSAVPSTGNDYVNKTYVDTGLAAYLPLSGGTISGSLTVTGTLTTGTRLLGVPDGVGSGNFWMGLTGSGSESDRLAISIAGNQTTGVVSRVTISKDAYFSTPTPSRALILDGTSKLTASATTSTELGYLSGTTSSVQTQLNTKLSLSGGTMTGDINMGSFFINCSNDPSSSNQLTRKSYVDTLIAGRVPRTGDTGLIGDYATSGSFSCSGLVSSGGVRASFYITSVSSIPYTNSTDKGAWFKIMNLGITTNVYYVEGHISYSVAGYHGHIHFIVSCMYNATPNLQIVQSSFYSSPIIEQLRLSLDNSSIYNQGYLEMYLANATWNDVTINVYGVNSSPANSLYSLVGSKTAGTSTGYTYYSVYTNVSFDRIWLGQRFRVDSSELYTDVNIHTIGAFILNNNGDCRIFNGGVDAYNPVGYNNLMIKSWWGIGYMSYDGTVRIAMDTRTGGGYYGGFVGIGKTNPDTQLDVYGTGTVIGARNTGTGDNYCAIRLGNNTGYGAYWFLNSSGRSADGGYNTCTLRNDLGSLRLQALGGGGMLIQSGTGAVNIFGSSPVAVPSGFMDRGSLTIGSTTQNYGWGTSGWSTNTAGLLLECADLTEIAVHDANHRVASLLAYAGGAGRNYIYMGRDMGVGWGTSRVITCERLGCYNTDPYMLFGFGGGNTSANLSNTGAWTAAANAMLITQTSTQGANSAALCMGITNETVITSLAPGLLWVNMSINASQITARFNGSVCSTTNAGGWANVSDAREKEDIQPLNTEKSLRRVLALRGKNYRRRFDPNAPTPVADAIKQRRYIGFLAQDVMESNPHCLHTWCNDDAKCDDDDGTRYALSYDDYIVHLVGAVQEQQKQIETLQERNKVLEAWARDQEAKQKKMEERMEKMASLIAQLMGK